MTILKSQHFTESDWQGYNESDYGSKVKGLKSLPKNWTPPYIVIPTEYFDAWTDLDSSDLDSATEILPVEQIGDLAEDVIEYWLGMDTSQEKFQNGNDEKLLVRSSASGDDISIRGSYTSKESSANETELIKSIFDVWSQATKVRDLGGENSALSVIVQAKVVDSGKGHLANERRVSRISTNWSLEWEEGLTKNKDQYKRFSVINVNSASPSKSLEASSPEEVENILNQVASWEQNPDSRTHYEWVWNGIKVWLVQRDTQEIEKRSAPGSDWPYEYPANFESDFGIMEKAQDVVEDWSKTDCPDVFKQCGLSCPELYILEGSKLDGKISGSNIDQDLRDEFKKLVSSPVVVRTDVKTEDEPVKVFSPRSDTITELDNLINFIIKTYESFKDKGYDSADFCFLLHHFILSRSSAFAQASPDNPIVVIDSIWGIPDGLNCYPHDTFHVNLNSEEIEYRKIRCKDRYLDVNAEGEWIEKTAGKPWDWKTSLSDNSIFSIAEQAHTVSKCLNKPVVVMFFVGLNDNDRDESLPWFFWPAEEFEDEDISSSNTRWSERTFDIRSPDDLNYVKQKVDEIAEIQDAVIEFNPSPEYVRDTDFVEEVANFASTLNMPVNLEGSKLSHAFYILQRTEAVVRTTSENEPASHSMRFSKLVRDKIPIKIEAGGETTRTYEVQKPYLVDLLKSKAVEEALEFGYADSSDEDMEELADIFEIIRSYAEATDTSIEEVKKIADNKREKKGGFSEGVVLISTENRIGIQEPLDEDSKIMDQPKLPTPLLPNEKIRDDLTPRLDSDSKSEIKIEAPLVPPTLIGLDGIRRFEVSNLDIDLELRYEGEKLFISINEEQSSDDSVDQASLDQFD